MESEYKKVMELTRIGYEVTIDSDGCRCWLKNGLYHREEGPAYETLKGEKRWYLNGVQHREGGPAVEYVDGTKVWFLNGKQHREDGPAVVFYWGGKCWYLNNIEVSEKDFNEVWTCPMDRLPLYINTEFAPIAKRRLAGERQEKKAYFKNLSLRQKIKYLFKSVHRKSILVGNVSKRVKREYI